MQGLDSDCYFVKMTWYCLNPNLLLNLCAALVLQSLITLAARILSIRILWDCFFVPLPDHLYVLHGLNDILLLFLLYVFHLTTILLHYLLLFLHHFIAISSIIIISFPGYFNHNNGMYSEILGFLLSSFISLYCLNAL